MRTRSQHNVALGLGLVSPPSTSPPPPIKDLDADQISLPTPEHFGQHVRHATTQETSNPRLHAPNVAAQTTPQQPKRVRFSDPGPHLSSKKQNSASSGLTPRLRRSTLSPISGRVQTQHDNSRKRKYSSTQLHTPESSPLLGADVQYFTPLKQSLDERTKRRLKRNHLSEETNEWEHEHRTEAKARRELAQLREEHAQKENEVKSLTLELELQRQRGIEFNAQEEEALENLRQELAQVKGKVASYEDQGSDSAVFDTDIDMPLLPDTFNDDWDDDDPLISSPSIRPRRPKTASPMLQTDVLHCSEQACQASLPDPEHETQISNLRRAIETLTQENNDSRAAIDIVRDELRKFGFPTAEGTSADDLVAAIRDAFRNTRLELERLLPGETECGFDNGKLLLDSLIHHLRALQQKSSASIKAAESQRQTEAALRRQFNTALAKLAELEQSIAEIMEHRTRLIAEAETRQQQLETMRDELQLRAKEVESNTTRITELETAQRESDIAVEQLQVRAKEVESSANRIVELETAQRESDIAVERLQRALKSYQDEAQSLETLISTLEQEKQELDKTMAASKRASDERLQDVERHAKNTAKVQARRIAELETDLTRAEEEVTVDREKLQREKGAFEARMQEMNMKCKELEESREMGCEAVQRLETTNVKLQDELQKVRERFEMYGEEVKSLFEGTLVRYKECWREQEDFLGKASSVEERDNE